MRGKKILTTLVVMAFIISTMLVINILTPFKIVEDASATPGIDAWEGNLSMVATGGDVLNTSVSSLYYESTIHQVIVNGSASWTSGITYYLYYPVYTGRYGGTGAEATYNLSWAKYMGDPNDPNGAVAPEINASAGDYSFGGTATDLEKNVKLNRSGLWLIDNDDTHNPTAANPSNSDVPAWFWVNSSDVFATTVSDTTFKYGDAGTITISVSEDGTTPTALCAIHNASGKLVGTWNHNEPYVDGSITLGKNASVFTNAGTWYVESYYDLDGGTGESGSHVSYLDSASGAGYDWYNESLYGTGTIQSQAGWYSYATCGPWDPPEHNDTWKKITVSTGEPVITMKNDSDVYWGFGLRLEVNATDNEGIGISSANVSLRKSGTQTYIYDGTYGDLWINETGAGNYSIEINRFTIGSSNWTNLANGSWYVVVAKDNNGDNVEEWNKSKRFSIKSSTPPVRINIDTDGDATTGTTTDNKVNVPSFTAGTNTVGTVGIDFTILGRDVGDSEGRAYYGDDTHENRFNITVSGDILYPDSNWLTNNGGGSWTATVTPTKPGGTITIAINWPGSNNGSASQTINIINGSTITANIASFKFGEDNDLTATVKDKYNNLQYAADVYLIWRSGPTRINQTVPGTGATGKGENGEYTYKITSTDMPSAAPDNITIAAKSPGLNQWGYASVKMKKMNDIMVNVTPTTGYAGDLLTWNIDVLVDGAAPDTYSDITVALYHDNGDLVSGDDAWSSNGAYDIDNEEHVLSGGTYHMYAYNNTHDSEYQNATIIITEYIVTVTPGTLAWLIDTAVNLSFELTPAGNGTLTVENMSSTPNCSATGETETIDILGGIGTLNEVNATTLGNLTFDYTPDGGEQREAQGLVKITTATATPDPATIYLNEPTTIEVTVTHPATGAPLEGVRVDLDYGFNLSTSKLERLPDHQNTDADGKAQFSVTAVASGNVTIFLEMGRDTDNPMIIKAAARKTMTISTDPSVQEGETFVVSAKDSSKNLITDVTVSITFNGVTSTTNTGTLELTAPWVPESLDYRIEATAEGYTSDDTTIKVINKPKLYVQAPSKKAAEESFTVTAGGDDGNSYGITITITDKNGNTVKTDTTVGPSGISFTIDKEGTYTIVATKDNYEPSDTATIKIEAPTPGFELLTLIIAIGIAFILLRRRRR